MYIYEHGFIEFVSLSNNFLNRWRHYFHNDDCRYLSDTRYNINNEHS